MATLARPAKRARHPTPLLDDLIPYVVAHLKVSERQCVRLLCHSARAAAVYQGDERIVVPAGVEYASIAACAERWRAAGLQHLTLCCTLPCESHAMQHRQLLCTLLRSLVRLRSLQLTQASADFTYVAAMPSGATTLRLSLYEDVVAPDLAYKQLAACAHHVRHLCIDSSRRASSWARPNMLPRTMACIGRALHQPAWRCLQSVSLPVLRWENATELLLRALVERGKLHTLAFGILTPAQGLPDMSFLLPRAASGALLVNRALRSLTMTYGGVRHLRPLPTACAALRHLDLRHTYENCLEEECGSDLFPPQVQLQLPRLRRPV